MTVRFRSQRVTAVDLKAGRIRVPHETKGAAAVESPDRLDCPTGSADDGLLRSQNGPGSRGIGRAFDRHRTGRLGWPGRDADRFAIGSVNSLRLRHGREALSLELRQRLAPKAPSLSGPQESNPHMERSCPLQGQAPLALQQEFEEVTNDPLRIAEALLTRVVLDEEALSLEVAIANAVVGGSTRMGRSVDLEDAHLVPVEDKKVRLLRYLPCNCSGIREEEDVFAPLQLFGDLDLGLRAIVQAVMDDDTGVSEWSTLIAGIFLNLALELRPPVLGNAGCVHLDGQSVDMARPNRPRRSRPNR